MVLLNPTHKFLPQLIPTGDHPSRYDYILPSVASGSFFGMAAGLHSHAKYGGSIVVKLGKRMFFVGSLFGVCTALNAVLTSIRGESLWNASAAGCLAGFALGSTSTFYFIVAKKLSVTLLSGAALAALAALYEYQDFTFFGSYNIRTPMEKRAFMDSFIKKNE